LNPQTYTRALDYGILDAPGLKGNPSAQGKLNTRMVEGACLPVDEQGAPLLEEERLSRIVPQVIEEIKSKPKTVQEIMLNT
jgi:hypothetical protein